MNQAPPLRLHWIPVCPSWIVSAGIVLLAVLPHKIPVYGRRLLGHATTRLLFAAAAIYVWMLKPVLGTAMLILLASLTLLPEAEAEPFTTSIINLNHDRVKSGSNKWLVEDTLAEKPHGIQDRTADSNLTYDEIPDESLTWHSEKVLDEHPTAIQDKPVAESTINDIWH
jgi:hypothetical protein